jgi:hypothetical protein
MRDPTLEHKFSHRQFLGTTALGYELDRDAPDKMTVRIDR